jgi:hypothetical protein
VEESWWEILWSLKVHKHEIILNFFYLNQNLISPRSIFKKNFDSFPSIFARILMFEHFRGDWAFVESKFFGEISIYSQNLHLNLVFLILFKNYCTSMMSIRGNDFYRTLSIQGNNFIAHWAYEEQIFAHAQPAVKCEQFLHVHLCWAYAERISSHTEHTQNEFHRWLSIRGMDFIAGWAYMKMFKSWISLPNRIRFSKISCYRPLGP